MNILISVNKIAKQVLAIWDQDLFADIGKYITSHQPLAGKCLSGAFDLQTEFFRNMY